MFDGKVVNANCYKISNSDYEDMTVADKKRLIKYFKMIGFKEQEFAGYWFLVPKVDEFCKTCKDSEVDFECPKCEVLQ